VRDTDITGRILCENSRETLLQADEDFQRMETCLRHAEDELRDVGKELALPRARSRRCLKDMRLLIEAGIEERKSWTR
jgi:hypothetical protein